MGKICYCFFGNKSVFKQAFLKQEKILGGEKRKTVWIIWGDENKVATVQRFTLGSRASLIPSPSRL